MMKKLVADIKKSLTILCCLIALTFSAYGQVDTNRMLDIGRNALYFEDYMLSIQYFNTIIASKPYLAQPYMYRAIAKLNLEDFAGAEADATKALELNPFLTDAWEVRGVARQNSGKGRLAVSDYNHALETMPNNRQLMFNKALTLTSIKDFDSAAAVFDELLESYPSFDNGYLGRARVRLEKGDTIGASEDIEKSLSFNDKSANAYIMRADIAINGKGDYESALTDMDRAIRLLPNNAGLYINRAFLRYNLNSFKGAMDDYDHAINLEPYNATALFNRGLLRVEVGANDLALQDFDKVLDLDPNDYRSLYNRALILNAKGEYDAALKDISLVAERFPDFPGALYIRSRIHQERGDIAKAKKDYYRAEELTRNLKSSEEYADNNDGGKENDSNEEIPAELVSKRFATLLTVDDNADIREEYNNTAIRGRIQDRNFNVEIEPMMVLSYYSSPDELRSGSYYVKEIDDLNATRALRMILTVTNAVPTLDEGIISNHLKSIEYYNSYLSSHKPRSVDYIGRALDFITVQDFGKALTDIDRAISMTPDFAPAYMLRAQALYGQYKQNNLTGSAPGSTVKDALSTEVIRKKALDEIYAELNNVIRLSPRMAVAWYNLGNILVEREDFDGADTAYSQAIELKPDMGEAFFNRGYVRLKKGDISRGTADLGTAGELGIAQAYNLIKRMSH